MSSNRKYGKFFFCYFCCCPLYSLNPSKNFWAGLTLSIHCGAIVSVSECSISESSATIRGWTLLMGNTRPECFLRGLKFSGKKIRVLKFLGENLRGLKYISKFDQIFFKISIFLEDTDPSIAKIVTISEIRKAGKPNF